MPKVILTESSRELERLISRMDRFDAVVVDYCRKYPYTMEQLAERLGCNTSTLWRYRKEPLYFKQAKFDVICRMLRFANVSNETLRMICGLPTGKNENGIRTE